jgi:hypothetical protein
MLRRFALTAACGMLGMTLMFTGAQTALADDVCPDPDTGTLAWDTAMQALATCDAECAPGDTSCTDDCACMANVLLEEFGCQGILICPG